VRVQHFDAATPVGYWIKDKYCPSGADGSECTDYPPPAGTTMIPLDLTHQVRSTPERIARLNALGTPLAIAVAELLKPSGANPSAAV